MKNMQLSQTQGSEQHLKLVEITMEPALQSRVVMSPKKVSDYQTAYTNGAVFPPVLVAKQINERGEPTYRLLDGWHRLKALINNGASFSHKVKALVIDMPSDTSIYKLRYIGGQENIKNGLGLTHHDKREMFRNYVKSKSNRDGNRYKSYRTIASELTLTAHQTIARWMKSDFPAIARAMGKEFGDEYQGQPSAQGTGIRLVDMPDLSSRERDIFAEVLVIEAKASENNVRGEILNWAKSLLSILEKEAPYKESILYLDPNDTDPF